MNRHIFASLVLLFVALTGCGTESVSQEQPQASPQPAGTKPATKPARVLCRLFVQDLKTKKLKWADVRAGSTLDAFQELSGFPQLDPETQNLVQMEATKGTLLVGIRDNEDGDLNSGWALVNTGVVEEPHGDHSHWHYESPGLVKTVVDKKQGNPAHLYVYDGIYYLANDRRNGYTRIDPGTVQPDGSRSVRVGFHQGGGNHITLAVAENTVGYGTWIDGGGPNKGRVDVTRIQPDGNSQIAYRFNLPSGAIHGATYAGDKVFFAPAEGVCWVQADLQPRQDREVKVNHIPLGKHPETKEPLRTGAFTEHRNHVFFFSGREDFAALGILNAAMPQPELIRVPLPMKAEQSPTVPQVIKTYWGKRLAFVFHDLKADIDGEEHLSIIELDPNKDLSFQDAKLLKTITVGKSAVQGHYGHHEISFDDGKKYAFWTNPGDGSVSMLSLKSLEQLTNFQVGGTPTKLIALGRKEG